VVYTDINKQKMKNIKIGQKVRVLSSKTLNASSPSTSKAIFLQVLD
jgi:hypothetical protein